MSAGTVPLWRERYVENEIERDESVLHERVHCQNCRWRGKLGDLLMADDPDNEMLYCPCCRNYSWVWT